MKLRTYSSQKRFNILYREIRRRICFLVYPPGTRLSETALAKEFGISRTPIRRALGRLEAEGLIEVTQGSATIVTGIDWQPIAEMFELREKLAYVAGELGFRDITERDLREMAATEGQLKALRARPTILGYAAINLRYHETYVDLIPNQALRKITELLYSRTNRIWMKELPYIDWQHEITLFREQVAMMINAMKTNNSRAIASIEAQMIRTGFDRVRKYLSEQSL